MPRLRRAALLACLLGAACATPRSTPADVLDRRVARLEEQVGRLGEQIGRLEEALARRADALAFLDEEYAARRDAEARPRPGVIYAVDIEPDLAIGQVIGPASAPVTIVEAWDFG